MSDHHLDSNRLAGNFAHMPDEIKQAVDVVKLFMAWRGVGILPHGDLADGGDLLGDLLLQEHAPLAWLCPLRKFHFKHFHLLDRCDFLE